MFNFDEGSNSILLELPEPQPGWQVDPHMEPCQVRNQYLISFSS